MRNLLMSVLLNNAMQKTGGVLNARLVRGAVRAGAVDPARVASLAVGPVAGGGADAVRRYSSGSSNAESIKSDNKKDEK